MSIFCTLKSITNLNIFNCTGSKCIPVNDTSTFDFNNFEDICLKELYDITTHVHNETKPHYLHGIKSSFLCKKDSLSSIHSQLDHTVSIHKKGAIVTASDVLNKKSNF